MRKMDETEKLQDVMERNSHFANFCRLLYEVTSFFSCLMEDETFYHGINCQLLFDKFHCNFNMPVSTTVSKDVAINFCNKSGIVLAMESNNSSNSSYTLALDWISAFPEEQERLFFETTLSIINLTNFSLSSKKSNKNFVKIISLYYYITNGAFLSTLSTLKDKKK
eukprot:287633_1